MHLDGKSADDIATERGIAVATVYGHFAEAIEAGVIEVDKVCRSTQPTSTPSAPPSTDAARATA